MLACIHAQISHFYMTQDFYLGDSSLAILMHSLHPHCLRLTGEGVNVRLCACVTL